MVNYLYLHTTLFRYRLVPSCLFTENNKTGRITFVIFLSRESPLFRGGAAVAQLTVNQLVAGSNPALGAKHKHFAKAECFCFGILHL